QASSQPLVEDVAAMLGETRGTKIRNRLRLPLKISLVEPVTIDGQPAQNGIQFCEGPFNAMPRPWESRVGPPCSHMQHIKVTAAGACGEARELIAAEHDSILQRQSHGRAFVCKTALLRLNLIQLPRQQILVVVRQSGAVTLEEGSPDGFKMVADRWVGAGEATTIKLHLARVNLQKPADE